ncbi:sigma-70 family RNA polymerase sigma factor [Lentzea sp. NPDC034063]|uniref:RNA polymerase sigma factor n=1 Tax=unclassified Lentzea TaxID=2643253 RepID=UPI0033EAD054
MATDNKNTTATPGNPNTPGVAAFSEFHRAELPRLIAFLTYLGYTLNDAEDAAQESLWLLYQQWDSIESPSKWVRVVAARAAARTAYTRKRVELAGSPGDVEELANASGLTFSDSEFRQRHEIIELLGTLPQRQRVALAWWLDGFTTREIAEAMDMRESTVRSSIRHARNRLRNLLDKQIK